MAWVLLAPPEEKTSFGHLAQGFERRGYGAAVDRVVDGLAGGIDELGHHIAPAPARRC